MSGGASVTEAPRERVKKYDFTRPDKFSKDQIRTLSIMHETFARQSSTVLSAALRCLAHVNVTLVDQLTYEEFIRSIPNPSVIAIVGMQPLGGAAVLEIDPAVAFAAIDLLFGGRGESPPIVRELTDIEASVSEGLVGRLMGGLKDAWRVVKEIDPRLTGLETHPMFAQVVPPREMVVLVGMEVVIGEAKGMMNLCLPYLTIEPVVPRLSALYLYSHLRSSDKGKAARVVMDRMSHFSISADICREGARLSLKEIGALRKGSLVPLSEHAGDRAFLRVGGRALLALRCAEAASGKARSYAVSAESQWRPSSATEPSAMEQQLASSLESVTARIDRALSGINGSIDELKKGQAALVEELAVTQSEQPAAPRRGPPFDFVRRADPAHFLGIIQQEHPQLVALVLSYLDPQKASAVLGGLSAELQPEVARRIAAMRQTHPEVLRMVESVLEKKLAVLSSEDFTPAGGVDGLVEILNTADRSTERNVVESLQKQDPALADELRRSMFLFEDIVRLDGEGIRKTIARVGVEEILRAMKAAPQDVQGFLWKHVPSAEAASLRKRFEEMGRLRLAEVEKAQARVVSVIREMDQNGEIVVPRPGEALG